MSLFYGVISALLLFQINFCFFHRKIIRLKAQDVIVIVMLLMVQKTTDYLAISFVSTYLVVVANTQKDVCQ